MRKTGITFLLLTFSVLLMAQTPNTQRLNLNKAERVEWFRNLGFGMFIHFSFDSQLGIVISHSMVGASDDYLDRYFNELPKTFNPKDFDATAIASLAKLAGMKYIVFTAKHHSGFCMWDTETTDFNIMNTPYGKDLVAEYVEATREAGLAVGFYFSPEDFNFLHENGQQVRRSNINSIPQSVMNRYIELNELQTIELMAKYGDIDILFYDGGDGPLLEKCKQIAWELHPDLVITRGAMETPEQTVPGMQNTDPWEANLTMGTQWAYKPTNEEYKSASRLLEILIETRAKGGNQLLNIGPKPNGEISEEQEARLREIAAWNFINGEAIEATSPWIIPNERDIWFTWKPEEKTLYAILTKQPEWTRGERRDFLLRSVNSTANTSVSVLGQSDELVEYQPETDAQTYFEQQEDGLQISCVRAQRIYNNHKWNNPLVIKITNAEPAFDPPLVKTLDAEIIRSGSVTYIQFKGELTKSGDTENLKACFRYRPYTNLAEDSNSAPWHQTESVEIKDNVFMFKLRLLGKEITYQYQTLLQHPKANIYGGYKTTTIKQ
ncbi:alpha-L-fucosidase [Draconibacterium sp. IB214405]|uniref:alpha-L-fucosidase n=1 Tax=Draconibacterium sp. IB214405 TaxID=3097352 RepID=UPI002A10AC0D|nr:alpha-L-fucosidase [Draconibacterium sp. IB214405]MDX8340133.1 alpha-L-fucosidase [Draconibacterium sp. IB214405]